VTLELYLKEAMRILTVGHSTHPIDEFLAILKAHGVKQLVDVRSIPKSGRHPQFNREALKDSLYEQGIAYTHIPGLGGLRRPRKDSINTAWKNASFRGYADHMSSAAFEESLGQLTEIAGGELTAIMCAEAVPWRCHRSLIGDALTARGIVVEDVLSKSSRKPHKLTPFAKIEGELVTYPGLL
jgi:uncharacterized protein (DUF488 family)